MAYNWKLILSVSICLLQAAYSSDVSNFLLEGHKHCTPSVELLHVLSLVFLGVGQELCRRNGKITQMSRLELKKKCES